ncbi:MAG: sugar ABC transporter substrate-binding protein [Oscillospiraceae bacterium]|nr:sugar ABC transporter substrate-binding protein [Oscillospiraceae bacterium]MDD4368609.1 sugar ABC transporter substrate-binding protein [Oscillospiraceae bacterium]
MKKIQHINAKILTTALAGLMVLTSACSSSGTAATTGTTAAAGSDSSAAETSAATTTEGDSSASTKLSFMIWDANQQPAMEAMAAAYTKEHPDVSIEIQLTAYKGGEYWTKLEAGMAGGNAPDVFWMNTLHVENYVDADMLAPLDDAVKTAGLDLDQDFPAALASMYKINDQMYGIPKDFDTNAVWYNKELFDAKGVAYPEAGWTWDDMVSLAKQLNDPDNGVYGIAAPLDFQTCYYNTVFAAGGWILNEDKTQSGYNDPKTQEGIQIWIDLINEGLSPSLASLTDTSADAMFESGKLAMIWAGSYMTPEYVGNEVIKDKIDLVELPTYDGNEANVINGLGYSVYSGSKNKEAAEAFAAWMGGTEAMKIQGETGVVISARNDAQQYFAASQPSLNLKAYTDKAAIATALPVSKVASEMYDLEANSLKLAYSGELSLADACAQAAEQSDALLAKMNK